MTDDDKALCEALEQTFQLHSKLGPITRAQRAKVHKAATRIRELSAELATVRELARGMTDWNTNMDEAPKDVPVLVYYDHDAAPYQDPDNPGRLTDYACHAETGDHFSGKGVTIAQWCDGWHEDDGWEAANPPYWMPARWLAQFNGDNSDYVVNPTAWMSLPPPPEPQP